MLENTAAVVVKAAELIVLTTAMGVIVSDLWVLPAARADGPQAALTALRIRLWKLLGLCLVALTFTSLIGLLVRAASMAELAILDAFPLTGTVLSETHYGHLWLGRAAALLALWLVWAMRWRRFSVRSIPVTALIALVVVSFTLSAAGHAGDGGVLALPNIVNSFHIVGGLVWGGIIIAAAAVILPSLRPLPPVARELIAAASLRMSTLATIALAMVVIPGIYNAWVLLGGWRDFWETLYGQLLLAKIIFVVAMIALGAVNRYVYVPAIQQSAGRPVPRTLISLPGFLRARDIPAPLAHFVRSLWLEGTLLLGVLALAAALSQQTPPAHF